ncbi:alpha-hydroxy acid oxidase [Novosphingobium sp. KACC 22771]|uniref:alpha-hydroxy acid oxidase n=1 Tax=Novosphingobium sp. KACC 22771 TaxID=3025670 RepID=UPI0023665AF0|nr:alpha-hydroxy acid oxidase [Novosphingobium sp. KACC 22771]WDF72064.1 alpha-hydroxy acid oxidase [Novosphingobium sp. KACC 22771]
MSLPPHLYTLADYSAAAQARVDPAVWAWLEGANGAGTARRREEVSFGAHAILNRPLADLRGGHTRRALLGLDLAHPVLLSPLGYHRLVHPAGELATAQGCLETVMCVSTMASQPIEAIAQVAAGPLWFQLYVQPRREDTLRLIRRAEAAGAKAIVVTLDTPAQPASPQALRAGFAMPPGIEAVHLAGFTPAPEASGQWYNPALSRLTAAAPGWDDMAWLRDQTGLPLLAKGMSRADDAARLMALGWNGLVLSTHGGRAMEAAAAPLTLLPAMRAALGAECAILLDGSVRTGADVFRALALGADAVMVGRPQLHGLAVGGALGVAHMLKILREELELAMVLAGCATLDAIGPDALAGV